MLPGIAEKYRRIFRKGCGGCGGRGFSGSYGVCDAAVPEEPAVAAHGAAGNAAIGLCVGGQVRRKARQEHIRVARYAVAAQNILRQGFVRGGARGELLCVIGDHREAALEPEKIQQRIEIPPVSADRKAARRAEPRQGGLRR